MADKLEVLKEKLKVAVEYFEKISNETDEDSHHKDYVSIAQSALKSIKGDEKFTEVAVGDVGKVCPECGGDKILTAVDKTPQHTITMIACPKCGGTGKVKEGG